MTQHTESTSQPKKKLAWFSLALLLTILSSFAVMSPNRVLPASAKAITTTSQGGNLWLTGHDADVRCQPSNAQCSYFYHAIQYVRDSSTLPLLLLGSTNGLSASIGTAFNAMSATIPASTTIDPMTTTFATLPLVDGLGNKLYSAIVVASSSAGMGTSQISATNARATDIKTFINAGGGVLALASVNAANYYGFLPISVTNVGSATSPYSLTLAATPTTGLTDTGTNDSASPINCCATHNFFAMPSGTSPFIAVEIDSSTPSLAVSMVAQHVYVGTNGFGTPVPTSTLTSTIVPTKTATSVPTKTGTPQPTSTGTITPKPTSTAVPSSATATAIAIAKCDVRHAQISHITWPPAAQVRMTGKHLGLKITATSDACIGGSFYEVKAGRMLTAKTVLFHSTGSAFFHGRTSGILYLARPGVKDTGIRHHDIVIIVRVRRSGGDLYYARMYKHVTSK